MSLCISKEKQLYSPVEGFFTGIATDCAKKQIAVDMFFFSFVHYAELVTLGIILLVHACHPSMYHDTFHGRYPNLSWCV